jgi:hypothetical protein
MAAPTVAPNMTVKSIEERRICSMNERYIPQIREAAIPEDGGWVKLQNESVLLLSIPEWEDWLSQSTTSYPFVWMYDRAEDAYLFCFRLNDQTEKAIAFAKEHAGLLLKEEQANGPFSILITSDALAQTTAQSPYLLLTEVMLKRHPQAGW